MLADILTKLLNDASDEQKYVWLKHTKDRNPQLYSFTIENNCLNVPLYLSVIDDYEGLMGISCDSVEWAHMSQQIYISLMQDRLDHANSTATLVSLKFSDFLDDQLFHCTSYAMDEEDTYLDDRHGTALGYFVNSESLLCDTEKSRIPFKILLDITNTDISADSIKPCHDFRKKHADHHLQYFDVNFEAP